MENKLFEFLAWEHCYIITGHGKKFRAKTRQEAISIKIAYCLDEITQLW